MGGFSTSRIIHRKIENSLVQSFTIKPVPNDFSVKKAGQYLMLKTSQADGWSEAHPFTITSRLGDEYLKISVKKLGKFTANLHDIDLPANVAVSGPYGNFGHRIDAEGKVVFIAGGIGITPFISLLLHLEESRSKADISLFWAVNKIDEYFSLDILREFISRLHIKIILVTLESHVERLDEQDFVWRQGYLTKKILCELSDVGDSALYMCGSDNMQRYIFSQIEELGILPDKVETEKFGVFMQNK